MLEQNQSGADQEMTTSSLIQPIKMLDTISTICILEKIIAAETHSRCQETACSSMPAYKAYHTVHSTKYILLDVWGV